MTTKPAPSRRYASRITRHTRRKAQADRPKEIAELVLRTLVDMMPDRIYAKDTQSRFIFANKSVAMLMGACPPEKLLGKTDFDFYPADIATQFFAVERDLFDTGQPVIALDQLVPDQAAGTEEWLQTTKVPLLSKHGKTIGLVGIGRDITERKRMEAELLRQNRELSALNERLCQTQEQLVQAEKLASLGRVVAGVAHELNTPLGNALTVITTLLEQNEAFSKRVCDNTLRRSDLISTMEAIKEGETLLYRNIARAAALVGDFKQLAVDQSSEMRRKFDLGKIIQELLVVLQPQFKPTPYELTTELSPGIIVDSYPGPLGQVITNLVLNTLTHAFEGRASGRVRIACAPLSETHALLVCSDNGIGMPPEVRRRIFEPFFTTKLGKGGSGLGLHIVHTIVTGLLGGRIEIGSTPEEGSEFRIVLPLVAPEALKEPPPPSQSDQDTVGVSLSASPPHTTR